jgi:hypothetical protein
LGDGRVVRVWRDHSDDDSATLRRATFAAYPAVGPGALDWEARDEDSDLRFALERIAAERPVPANLALAERVLDGVPGVNAVEVVGPDGGGVVVYKNWP